MSDFIESPSDDISATVGGFFEDMCSVVYGNDEFLKHDDEVVIALTRMCVDLSIKVFEGEA